MHTVTIVLKKYFLLGAAYIHRTKILLTLLYYIIVLI